MAGRRQLRGMRRPALVRARRAAGSVALGLAVPAVDALEMYLVGTPSAGDRNSLPAALGEPVHLAIAGPAPLFPVTDAAAVRAPEPLLFYQVIARSADGVRGGL